MTQIDRLLALAAKWADATGQSSSTMATKVVNDGKFFERLKSGGSCTTPKAEKLFGFFRDGASWPDAIVPEFVGEYLDGVDLGVSAHADGDTPPHPAAATGKAIDVTATVPA